MSIAAQIERVPVRGLTSGSMSVQPSGRYSREEGHNDVGHRADEDCACKRGAQEKREVRIERSQ
jgi:hypothetical protein